ncbi:MAG: hypothetical protein WB822_13470 [Rhodoplanes sp.]
MHKVLSWLAIGFAFLSAALWFYAAVMRVPIEKLGSGFGTVVGLDEIKTALKRQAFWNTCAATATGAAALFQALTMLLG